MRYTIIVFIIICSLIIPSYSYNLTINDYVDIGEDYTDGNITLNDLYVYDSFSRFEVRKIYRYIKEVTSEVKDQRLKDLFNMDTLNILISRNLIMGISGYEYKLNKKYYIVMCQKRINKYSITATLFHELGHVYSTKNKIDMNFYSKSVYDLPVDTKSTCWSGSIYEDFAEDFKVYMFKKEYPTLSDKIKKYTDRNYDYSKFNSFISSIK